MTPQEYVKRGREANETDFVYGIAEHVRELSLTDLLKRNPTMAQMRSVEYVRDIGHGHYPHTSDYELVEVVKLLQLHIPDRVRAR